MEMIVPFLTQVNKLTTGEKAALKRSVGTTLAEADGKALAAFYRCLPEGIPWHQEDRWYAVACLQCLWDTKYDEYHPIENVIASMIRAGRLSQSTLHRIEILLDTPWDAEGHMLAKLTRLLKMLRQAFHCLPIDFAALLEDLIYWNASNQSVQKKWARTIFSTNAIS